MCIQSSIVKKITLFKVFKQYLYKKLLISLMQQIRSDIHINIEKKTLFFFFFKLNSQIKLCHFGFFFFLFLYILEKNIYKIKY